MATIINIDTSTEVCSVSLSKDGNLIGIKENKDGLKHAQLVTLYIQDLLKEANIEIKNLDAIAVSKGPGSYTGLRIGVSTAKGICYGAQLPLIAIETLQTLTEGAINSIEQPIKDAWFCPMIDARRMEVYNAFYNINNNKTVEIAATIIDDESFKDILDERTVYFFGNGSEKCKETIKHPNAIFIDNISNSALNMITLAHKAFNNQSFEDVAYFEPFYLKDFVATTPKKKMF